MTQSGCARVLSRSWTWRMKNTWRMKWNKIRREKTDFFVAIFQQTFVDRRQTPTTRCNRNWFLRTVVLLAFTRDLPAWVTLPSDETQIFSIRKISMQWYGTCRRFRKTAILCTLASLTNGLNSRWHVLHSCISKIIQIWSVWPSKFLKIPVQHCWSQTNLDHRRFTSFWRKQAACDLQAPTSLTFCCSEAVNVS